MFRKSQEREKKSDAKNRSIEKDRTGKLGKLISYIPASIV